VERLLAERGDALPVHEKARAENLATEARQVLRDDNAPLERLRTLTADLQQLYQGLAMAGAPGAGQPGGQDGTPDGDRSGSDDDVIDAEFTTNE
jgi:molecular chaperone DnaK